jgi:putative Mg2+ transporter-C (MgtC) family protein
LKFTVVDNWSFSGRVKITFMEILEESLLYLIPLAVALVVGVVIGIERERRDKIAGLRTMVLLALGSASVVLIIPFLAEAGVDTSSVIATVILSFGLLSLGVILKLGANANGLTTATSLWLVALLGLLSGTGEYLLVVIITLLTLVVVWAFPFIEKLIGGKKTIQQIDITIKNKDELEDEVFDIFDELEIKMVKVTRTRVDTTERTVHISAELTPQKRKDLSEIIVNEKNILKFSV